MYEQRFETKHSSSMDFGPYGLGATINPMQNQLQGANVGMNWGLRNLEVGFMGSRWEGAPIGKLGTVERDEMVHLAKLNKVNLTVHAPLKDPAGFNGKTFDETTRLDAMYDFKESLTFADKIGSETGVKHVPVVIHCSNGSPGNPNPEEMIYFADRETGDVGPIRKREETINRETAELYLGKDKQFFKDNFRAVNGSDPNSPGKLTPTGWLKLQDTKARHELGAQLASIDYSIEIVQDRMARASGDKKQIELYKDELRSLEFNREMIENNIRHMEQEYKDKARYVTTDEMAKEKVAETMAELGEFSYKLPSQPLIAVENIYPEMALGKPEQIGETVELARKKFIEKMSPKIGSDAARNAAENILGATLDIGHLNTWRKYKNPDTGDNYTKEDIERWAMKAQKYVKHMHLTDNFGDEDTHLPVGWGNAPIKEVVDRYKKVGFKGRMILETAGVGEKGSQMMIGIPESIQSLGYSLGPHTSWSEAAGSYFMAGYSFTGFQNFPDISFQTYGNGFSGLPYATGAQFPGAGKGEGSRFSGSPMS